MTRAAAEVERTPPSVICASTTNPTVSWSFGGCLAPFRTGRRAPAELNPDNHTQFKVEDDLSLAPKGSNKFRLLFQVPDVQPSPSRQFG